MSAKKIAELEDSIVSEWEELSPRRAAFVFQWQFPGLTFPPAADPDVRSAMRAMLLRFGADPLLDSMYYVWASSPKVKSEHASVAKRSDAARALANQTRVEYLTRLLDTIRRAPR